MNTKSNNFEKSYRVGIDIGGTFTDIVLLLEDGKIFTKKVNSTPEEYSYGAVKGLKELIIENGLNVNKAKDVVHATTVATNTILEEKGARTALITTKGFRDILEFRRVRFPELYNLQYSKPSPLVERKNRFEVNERVDANGLINVNLDRRELISIAKKINKLKIEAVAICFLHSYKNSIHEKEAKKILGKLLSPDIFLCTSYEILPEIREYERTSTTVVNAYLGPVIKSYLGNFSKRVLDVGISAPCYVMQSSGGQMLFKSAIRSPAYLLESGPAAGVIAAVELAMKKNIKEVITLDIGGTTAKTALIENFEPKRTSEYEVGSGINLSSKLTRGAGYAVKLPFIDISEIGAGGGSIVWFDEGHLLKVGPKSAGSSPGPIAYNKGGKEITLTDANIVLGFLNSKFLLGGSMPIDGKLSEVAIKEKISKKINLNIYETANGILKIAIGNMVRAVKSVTTYQGKDPRSYTLVVYGGNGSLLASSIADDLNISKILIPNNSGVLSALGLLYANSTYEKVQSFQVLLDNLTTSKLIKVFDKLIETAKSEFPKVQKNNNKRFNESLFLDLRYLGQAYEISVNVNRKHLSNIEKIKKLFHFEHQQLYGNSSPNETVELVNVRVSVSLPSKNTFNIEKKSKFIEPKSKRYIYFTKPYGRKKGKVFTGRHELGRHKIYGPSIIEEYDTTIIIPKNWYAFTDEYMNIILKKI